MAPSRRLRHDRRTRLNGRERDKAKGAVLRASRKEETAVRNVMYR